MKRKISKIISAEAEMCLAEPIYFTANRPFMYKIESPSGETLFEGVVQSFD